MGVLPDPSGVHQVALLCPTKEGRAWERRLWRRA